MRKVPEGAFVLETNCDALGSLQATLTVATLLHQNLLGSTPQAQLEKHRGGHSCAVISPCVQHCEHHLILIQSQMFVQKWHSPDVSVAFGATEKSVVLPIAWMLSDTWHCLCRLSWPALCKFICVRVWGHLVTDLRHECMRS